MRAPSPLRRALDATGVGAVELARRTGLTLSTIKKAARGGPVSRRSAALIARAMGGTVHPGTLVVGWQRGGGEHE